MRKSYLMLILLLLAACGPAGTQGTATQESSEPTTEAETSISEATVMATEAVDTAEEIPETVEQSDESPVADLFPATNLTEASAVRSTDHVRGATEPIVSIIEYGDFQ